MASTIFKFILSAINRSQQSCQSITDRYRHSASRVSMRVCLRRCSRKEMFISRSVTVNLTYFKKRLGADKLHCLFLRSKSGEKAVCNRFKASDWRTCSRSFSTNRPGRTTPPVGNPGTMESCVVIFITHTHTHIQLGCTTAQTEQVFSVLVDKKRPIRPKPIGGKLV